MEAANGGSTLFLALSRACEKCTRSKKKCNKARPRCERCERLDADCLYNQDPRFQSKASGSPGPKSDNFIGVAPLSNFDDGAVNLLSILHNSEVDWRSAVTRYFGTVHNWFSILHRNRFLGTSTLRHGNQVPSATSAGDDWLQEIDTDVIALLVLCMSLLAPSEKDIRQGGDVFSELYRTTKRAFATLSCLSEPNIELVQCGALLSLFEFGHGRSKFAYRTLSETSAMARTADITPAYSEKDTKFTTQELEDILALWWGIYILDQYIHMDPEANGLPFLTEEPPKNCSLPKNGFIWNGETYLTFRETATVNTAISIDLGTFQRAAQAAVLLRKVHLWNATRRGNAFLPPLDSLEELDSTIRAMLKAIIEQSQSWEVFCDSFAMCLCALFNLYNPYLQANQSLGLPTMKHSTDDNIDKAIAAIQFCVQFILDLATTFNDHVRKHPKWLTNIAPPATIPCAQALRYILIDQGYLENGQVAIKEIYKALQVFCKRWKLGEHILHGMLRQTELDDWMMKD